jgi:hypothetical protein
MHVLGDHHAVVTCCISNCCLCTADCNHSNAHTKQLAPVRANLFALLAAEGTELRVREHIPSGGRLRHRWNVTVGTALLQQLELQQPTWHMRWQQCLLSLGLATAARTSTSTNSSSKVNNSKKLKLTVMAEECHPLTSACVAALVAQQHGTSMTFIGMLAFIATAASTAAAAEQLVQRQCECSCLCCCACDNSSEHQDDGVLDASFVCEWSAVQVAAWHVNAALSAFSLPQLALQLAQLRPAAALHVYRRLRCDDSSSSSSSTASSSNSSSSVADISDIMAMVSASGWSDRAEYNCLQACGAADTTRRRNVATALAALRECSSAIA